MELETIRQIVQDHGLAVLFPVAILEGPIVTVIAAWLARQGLMNVIGVYLVCVVADLVGDAGMYWLGRRGVPPRLRRRLGVSAARLTAMRKHFRENGPRTLVIGKITHSAGFAVLLAAGASRMPFWPFLWWNLIATLPKTALFLGIGWVFGGLSAQVDTWIFRVSMVLLALIVAGAALWLLRQRGAGEP